jgi:hypothetical protein
MRLSENYEDFVEKTYFILRFTFNNLAKTKMKLIHIKTIVINLKSFLFLRNFIYRMKNFFLIKDRKGSLRGYTFRQKNCEQKNYIFYKEFDSFPKTIFLALKFVGKIKIEAIKNWKILDFKRFSKIYNQDINNQKNLFSKKSTLYFFSNFFEKLNKQNFKNATNFIFFTSLLGYKDVINF